MIATMTFFKEWETFCRALDIAQVFRAKAAACRSLFAKLNLQALSAIEYAEYLKMSSVADGYEDEAARMPRDAYRRFVEEIAAASPKVSVKLQIVATETKVFVGLEVYQYPAAFK